MATKNSINNKSQELTIDPGASGDSFVQFDINGTGEFRIGVDDTDDSFRISQGSALGTSDTFIMTASGERTMPLQPAFAAQPSGTLSNVTGDGTAYTVVFATEDFDQGGNFDGTSTFTAPVTGTYFFNVGIRPDDLTTSVTQATVEIDVNTGTLYKILDFDPASGVQIGGDIVTWSSSIVLSLTAADTVAVVFTASGTTKTVDLLNTNNATYFAGYLIA